MAAFNDFVAELLEPLGGVTLRPMLGGTALLREGRMFAFTLRDVLYFKTDTTTEPRFREEGTTQFAYAGMKGRKVAMSYFALPPRLLDDQEELLEWARQASAVSQRTAKKPVMRSTNSAETRRKKAATAVEGAAPKPSARRR